MEDVRRQVNEAVQSRHVSMLLSLSNIFNLFLDYYFAGSVQTRNWLVHAFLMYHLALVDFGMVDVGIIPSTSSA